MSPLFRSSPVERVTDAFGTRWEARELRKVKEGAEFKRKPHARGSFIRNHYNRKNAYGMEAPASFTCVDAEYPWGGREIYLKPTTIVWVEVGA